MEEDNIVLQLCLHSQMPTFRSHVYITCNFTKKHAKATKLWDQYSGTCIISLSHLFKLVDDIMLDGENSAETTYKQRSYARSNLWTVMSVGTILQSLCFSGMVEQGETALPASQC